MAMYYKTTWHLNQSNWGMLTIQDSDSITFKKSEVYIEPDFLNTALLPDILIYC